MGQKYIVLGRKADNSVEMLASPSVAFGKMKDVLHKNGRNEKFDEVQMFALVPHTRAYHPAATLKMEADIAAKGKNPDGSDPDKGPTVQEFVTAGYDPKNYPPQGFNSRSTPEEIAKAIAEYEPAEFKGKTDAELLKAATDLKLEIKTEATRAEMIGAIRAAADKSVEKNQKGFFAKLFGSK